jgi:hypothetical protein
MSAHRLLDATGDTMTKQHKIKQIYEDIESKAKDITSGAVNFAKDAFESIPDEHKDKIKQFGDNLSHNFETHIKYDLSKLNKNSLNFWKAKFFGALIGVILFGVPGLFVGLIVGHFLDLSQKSTDFKNFAAKCSSSRNSDKYAEPVQKAKKASSAKAKKPTVKKN